MMACRRMAWDSHNVECSAVDIPVSAAYFNRARMMMVKNGTMSQYRKNRQKQKDR